MCETHGGTLPSVSELYRVRHLPPRYEEPWRETFDQRFADLLRPGLTILDMGAGRSPCIPPDKRPTGCTYVGIDVSAEELNAAPAGSYDEVVCAAIEEYQPNLQDRFDLVISWQVLEHVRSLPDSLRNIRHYLRPGGLFVGQLSGRFAISSVLNAMIPRRPAVWIMEKLLARSPKTVFPAPYNSCWYSALVRLGDDWTFFTVTPRYCNAIYFNFSSLLQRAYLAYEDYLESRRVSNLAPHYLITAIR
ncbi:MAG: class I SAM-dependent methyltransferase [Actinobacteria bacterium]|nr:class I SAM-dependent methyltransferase [Actinomycetota bacterium]